MCCLKLCLLPMLGVLTYVRSDVMSNLDSGVIELNDDVRIPKEFSRMGKMQKGQVARGRLLVFGGVGKDGVPSLKGMMVEKFNDKEKQSSYSSPTHNPALVAAMKNKFGLPKLTGGFVFLLYETNARGEVIRGGAHEFCALTVPSNQIETLRMIHREHGLHSKDLMIKCTDPNFNAREFSIGGNSFFEVEFSEAERADLIARAEDLHNNSLSKQLVFKKPDADLWALCGVSAPAGNVGGTASSFVQQRPAFGGAGAAVAQGGVSGGGFNRNDDQDDDIPF